MDLNAPLGLDSAPQGASPTPEPPDRQPRRRRVVAMVAGGLVVACGLGALGAFLATADPHGGEPYGVAAIQPAAPKPARQVETPRPDPSPTGSLAPTPRMTALPPPGAQSQSGQAPAGGPLVIDVAKVLAERRQGRDPLAAPVSPEPPPLSPAAPLPVPPLLTPAAPARGDQAAARAVDRAAEPKIAIVVAGMGFGASATRTATEIMPAAVTFAFTPYGDTIAATVAAAKAKGHEILLQLPMQDAGAPAPGPYALHAGEPAREVAVDAAWAFGRFDGYAGVSNFLGAPVTADKAVMEALLRAVGARNLFYLDDGTSRRSLGPVLAREQGVAAARADVVLDATADPAIVRGNLEALAGLAKRKGAAIGLASGLPEHLAAIAAFASGLHARGIALVPVGALAARGPAMVVAQ